MIEQGPPTSHTLQFKTHLWRISASPPNRDDQRLFSTSVNFESSRASLSRLHGRLFTVLEPSRPKPAVASSTTSLLPPRIRRHLEHFQHFLVWPGDSSPSHRDYGVAPVDLAPPKYTIPPAAAIGMGMGDTSDDPEAASGAMEGVRLLDSNPNELRCCCGKDGCVFLRHNCSVLSSVERDVHAAAKMGQTLLARHEAYMASAERDRVELMARIELLEQQNTELEAKNKLSTDENQTLRDELDGLNETVKDADSRIELLEATLRDSQREVKRLEGAAERAANLERQIAALEQEQQTLQNTLVSSREEARTAVHRWKEAERGLIDLQEQLDRMEKEARQERERHVEVLSRMERQRNLEKELSSAAGRLKGAAGVRSMTDSKNGHSALNNFVKDLMQDNTRLQMGMAELREMLMNSNDEIQFLRQQLEYHQPVDQGEVSVTPTLRAELQQKESPASPTPPGAAQQFHIHHHYHVTHRPDQRKPKKRRQGLTAGTFTPPHLPAPRSPIPQPNQWQVSRGVEAPFPTHTPKDSTSTISITPYGRWSLVSENPSEFAPSSAPSSPPSANRSSMFDRGIIDLSSPTSPTTSVDPTSPIWKASHRKQGSELSGRSDASAMLSATLGHCFPDCPPSTSYSHPLATVLHEDDIASQEARSPCATDDLPGLVHNIPSADDATVHTESTDAGAIDEHGQQRDYFDPRVEQRSQRLRRVVSYESIMSLSNGMDIHTLKVRPSQLALRPLGLTTAGTNLSDVIASPEISRNTAGRRMSVMLRDNLSMAGLAQQTGKPHQGNRTVSNPVGTKTASRQSSSSTLGKLVSWRPWGGSTISDASLESSPVASPLIGAATPATVPVPPALLSPPITSVSKSSHVSPPGSLSSTPAFRAPGINQAGMIPGFQEYWAHHKRRGAPSKVTADNLEQIQEAMREVLDDG